MLICKLQVENSGKNPGRKIMKQSLKNDIKQAVSVLRKGGVIAYPTEAVFGLGCDPFNEKAVMRLLKLKKRSPEMGLILLVNSWEEVWRLAEKKDYPFLKAVEQTWPGPFTWIFPASPAVPAWIKGEYGTVALRISKHPLIRELLTAFGQPLVSTSANLMGEEPAKTIAEVQKQFSAGLDYILPGEVLGDLKPTMIRDVVSGEVVRG
jgi:L-threonylcarbamoyladenylate synthase